MFRPQLLLSKRLQVVVAVQGRILVLLDDRIRRGTDVFKTLALGVQAVMVGRPVGYGLAMGWPQRGNMELEEIEMLKDELELTMALSGCATINDITSNHVKIEIDNLHCRL